MDIILWDFLILYQILFSPQVERSVIISNKHGIPELPHELPFSVPARRKKTIIGWNVSKTDRKMVPPK